MQESLRLPGGTPPVRPSAAWRVAAPSLVADVLGGLRETPKRLSPTYFYDEVGSQLFEQICGLPEYYITRTETAILERHAREIAQRVGEDAMLVELGSGASNKTRLLLDRLPDLAAYVPWTSPALTSWRRRREYPQPIRRSKCSRPVRISPGHSRFPSRGTRSPKSWCSSLARPSATSTGPPQSSC